MGPAPGPDVRQEFLRTYAEALGLDARLLVEEYKLRHERLSDDRAAADRAAGRARRAGAARAATAHAAAARGALRRAGRCVLAVLAGDLPARQGLRRQRHVDADDQAATTPAPAAGTRRQEEGQATHGARRASPRLQILATGPVYVCLKAAGGRTLVNGATLAAGARTNAYRSVALRSDARQRQRADDGQRQAARRARRPRARSATGSRARAGTALSPDARRPAR